MTTAGVNFTNIFCAYFCARFSYEHNDRGGYFEYGNFENGNFNTMGILKNLRLVSSIKCDGNLKFNFEKVKFENVLRNQIK